MPFVERDGGGDIISAFTFPLVGRAEEHVDETDPELVQFRTRRTRRNIPNSVEAHIQADETLRRLVSVLADEVGKTPRQIIDAIKAKP
jgi:hypothetical protein